MWSKRQFAGVHECSLSECSLVFQNDFKSVWGYECPLRGVGDDGSWLMPKQLLEWAAQERLIFMLDRICRETHIRNAAALLSGDVVTLINFLPTAIYEPSFCLKTTIAAAKSAGIEPNRVQGAAKSEMHRIIVRALVQIARASGCLILAEGVETEAELMLMKSFGGRSVPRFPA